MKDMMILKCIKTYLPTFGLPLFSMSIKLSWATHSEQSVSRHFHASLILPWYQLAARRRRSARRNKFSLFHERSADSIFVCICWWGSILKRRRYNSITLAEYRRLRRRHINLRWLMSARYHDASCLRRGTRWRQHDGSRYFSDFSRHGSIQYAQISRSSAILTAAQICRHWRSASLNTVLTALQASWPLELALWAFAAAAAINDGSRNSSGDDSAGEMASIPIADLRIIFIWRLALPSSRLNILADCRQGMLRRKSSPHDELIRITEHFPCHSRRIATYAYSLWLSPVTI